MTQHNHPPARNPAAKWSQIALSSLVVLSMLLVPSAAMAQDNVPGTTIPEPANASDAAVQEVPAYVPEAPAAFSGGTLDGDFADESELSSPVDYEAIESSSTELTSIATVDSSSFEEAPEIGPLTQEAANERFLPLVQWDHNPNRVAKLGFGAGARDINTYQDIRKLNAGWYVNWRVMTQPNRPGLEYVQMVRVHQVIDKTKVYDAASGTMCGSAITADRTICPYVSPPQYIFSPSASAITNAAKANRGAIWLIGNEMERYDWNGGSQDEITPELYAVAFHDLRAIIKAADPTARVAIGGVIQFTPLRAQWLDRVWARYQQLYHRPIDGDIDVFNIHNFIGSELCEIRVINGRNERVCTGMGIPVGVQGTIVGNREQGAYIGQDSRHLDILYGTFGDQIIGFRTWMKQKSANNVNKPLIVTEYGALYSSLCGEPADAGCVAYYKETLPWGYPDFTDPAVVRKFMTDSFNYFNAANDCDLASQAAFNCKLVQRWAWFGLDDVGWKFNPHGELIDVHTGKLTGTGEVFSSWAASQ